MSGCFVVAAPAGRPAADFGACVAFVFCALQLDFFTPPPSQAVAGRWFGSSGRILPYPHATGNFGVRAWDGVLAVDRLLRGRR